MWNAINSLFNLRNRGIAHRGKEILTSGIVKGQLSIIDQGIVSGAHLFMYVLLARYTTPKDYGIFVLAYVILTLFSYFQRCLVVAPMTVIAPSLQGENIKNYLTSTLFTQLILGTTITLITLTVLGITSVFYSESLFLSTFCAMAIASFAFQGQEFFRRMLFTQQRIQDALLNDILSHCLQVIGLVILLRLGMLSGCYAFWVLLISTALGTAYGFVQCRGLIDRDLGDFKWVVKGNWDYGKWLLVSMFAQWVSGQIYIFLAAGMLTVAAAGVLGAARNIFGLLNMAVNGLRSFIVPYASKRFSVHGLVFLKGFTNRLCLIGTIGVVIYCLIVSP